MAQVNQRNQSIDLIKILAMCGVMTLHTTLRFDNYDDPVSRILFIFSGLSMPLFFMVSGYLMIGRDYDYKKVIRKILRIIRFVLFISIITWALNLYNDNYNIKALIATFVFSFVKGGHIGIFWYFGAISICYLLVPMFNKIYQKKEILVILFLSLVIVASVFFVLNITDGIEMRIRQTFRLWNWLLYFLLGGIIKKYQVIYSLLVSKKSTLVPNLLRIWGGKKCLFLAIIICCVFVVVVYNKLIAFLGTYGIEYMFGSTLWIALATMIFIMISSLQIHNSLIINSLSKLFLPVYAIHMHVITFFLKCVNFGPLGVMEPIAELFCVIVSTIAFSWLLMKIPVINKIFKL